MAGVFFYEIESCMIDPKTNQHVEYNKNVINLL